MSAKESVLGRGVIVVWLTIMWILLWGDLNLANLLSGLALAVALVVLFPPGATNDDPVVIRPFAAAHLVGWFLWALVQTNVAVAKEALLPASRSSIRTAVVATPLQTRSGRMATIIANAITLTPGTLTIDARGRPAVLYVHVLAFDSVEATVEEVADLERRVIRAFGTAEEVARICGPGNPDDAALAADETHGEVTS